MNTAVFIDRDGTINEEVGYIDDVNKFKLLPNSSDAIRLLNEHKFLVIVVSNQSGVARGYFPIELVEQINKRMKDELLANGAYIDDIYYCPHHPDGKVEPYNIDCNCRKPKIGMLLSAKEKYNLDLTKCFVIGDKMLDVEFGKRAGAKGILVLTGYGLEEYKNEQNKSKIKPDYIATNLYDGVKWLIKTSDW